jgi:uncharacterized membrane protein
MKNTRFYAIILIVSLIILILEVFAFKLTGAFGLIICIISIYFIVGSLVRLLTLAGIISKNIAEKINVFFF